ncbi:MAG: hypothetical protein Hyperionvirus17_8 [Hyperionvirus sp.]|uniref:Uncharacterized protein n=1 Tax=Hyperionvirus sp. TaxID=2487770 RepID=A0A3G5AA12_9VIRU|nr:MAG: hypothetical protein Hyperionvirus17_8 [Hyperionvirus sp.]
MERPRKSFKIDHEGISYEVTSGGAIIYRLKNGILELLLSHNRSKYEDLGGTAENTDTDINHTVAREVEEESNKLISQKSILERIKNQKFIFSKTSKYILYILPATPTEASLTTEDFGTKEFHDNIPRTVHWIPFDEFINPATIKNKLNFRLKNRKIFEQLALLSPKKDDIYLF